MCPDGTEWDGRQCVVKLARVVQGGGGNGDMVEVPAGEFYYGCNEQVDSECDSNEKPGRTRSLDTFRIDRSEVTLAAYGECVDAGACSAPDSGRFCNWGCFDRTQHPVNCVDWNQALGYCKWRGARLPSEQEWEKAARGTDGRKYPWGDEVPSCNYAIVSYGGDGCGRNSTWPVGSKPLGASPYGASDMVGNVWEWTYDWYDSSRGARVLRGGSWWDESGYARASLRSGYGPRYRRPGIGFRCAR